MARSRSGFTLIEVLVVVTLVALLTAILVPASMAVIGTSRDAATKANLRIWDSILSSRVAAMEIANSKSPFYELVVFTTTLTKQANSVASPSDKARIEAVRDAAVNRITTYAGTDPLAQKALVKKEYFRLYFPQTWEEAEFQLALNGLPAVATNPNSETESAEVLYFVLASGKVIGSVKLDSEVIQPSSVRDTDGNGRNELVDSWGRPVRFYRWPTRLLKDDGANITANNRKLANMMFMVPSNNETSDPLDPIAAGASTSSGYETDYCLPGTYYSMFITSAGPDGVFGLENPCNASTFGKWCKAANPADAFDNISSRAVNTN